jgi:hypothetical protein
VSNMAWAAGKTQGGGEAAAGGEPGDGDARAHGGRAGAPAAAGLRPSGSRPGDLRSGDLWPGDLRSGDLWPGDLGSGDLPPGGLIPRPRPGRLRTFNPTRVGNLEAAVWVAYYQREWARFLALSVLVVRSAFGMDWIRTVHGAWLVLRANQLWAPPPTRNDPAGARRCMRRFYALLRLAHGEPADPARTAELEVEWWRVHRIHQRGANGDAKPLVDALSRLYAFSFGIDEAVLRPAAEHRVRAMDIVDQWVTEGRLMDSPLLPAMRAALVRSYAAMLAAVHR